MAIQLFKSKQNILSLNVTNVKKNAAEVLLRRFDTQQWRSVGLPGLGYPKDHVKYVGMENLSIIWHKLYGDDDFIFTPGQLQCPCICVCARFILPSSGFRIGVDWKNIKYSWNCSLNYKKKICYWILLKVTNLYINFYILDN